MVRLPVVFAGVFGDIQYALDNTEPPVSGAFAAVSTRYFQVWFRDPSAGGSNYDLSDGLRITFGV